MMSLQLVELPKNCPTCGQEIEVSLALNYDANSRILIAGGCAIYFQKAEHGVMMLMLSRFGQCIDRSSLIVAAWSQDEPDDTRQALGSVIYHLRLKLIHTGLDIICHWNIGYALVTKQALPLRRIGRHLLDSGMMVDRKEA